MTRRLNRNKSNAMFKNKQTKPTIGVAQVILPTIINQTDESLTQYRYLAQSTKLDIEYIHGIRGRRRLSKRFVTMTAASCNHTCRVLCKRFSAKPKKLQFCAGQLWEGQRQADREPLRILYISVRNPSFNLYQHVNIKITF